MKEQEKVVKPRRSEARPVSGEGTSAAEAGGATAAPRRSTSRTQEVDRHVGARVRERRIMLGLTQQQLADLIGVTYQQAHKYERGITPRERMCLELARNFAQIPNERHQEALSQLARALAAD